MSTAELVRYITFSLHVRDLCLMFNASVISWWRSTDHNRDLDGHAQSFHLEGLAVDLELDNPARVDELTDEARRRGLQVAPKEHGAHIELDYRNP